MKYTLSIDVQWRSLFWTLVPLGGRDPDLYGVIRKSVKLPVLDEYNGVDWYPFSLYVLDKYTGLSPFYLPLTTRQPKHIWRPDKLKTRNEKF